MFLEGKVWDAGAFMLETQKPNSEWPRDSVDDAVQSEPTDRDCWYCASASPGLCIAAGQRFCGNERRGVGVPQRSLGA